MELDPTGNTASVPAAAHQQPQDYTYASAAKSPAGKRTATLASANVAVISRNLDEEYPSLATAAARTVPRPIQAKLKRPVRSDLSAKAVAKYVPTEKPAERDDDIPRPVGSPSKPQKQAETSTLAVVASGTLQEQRQRKRGRPSKQ